MDKRLLWVILGLLILILIWLGKINSTLEGIDWDVRQILGKVAYLR